MIFIADKIAPGALSDADLKEIELLLHREAEFLDQARYDDWLALYTDDCRYWIPASRGQADPVDEISLFYEDRDLMEMRISRIQHARAHSLDNPVTTSHVSGDRVIEDHNAETGELTVTARFQVVEHQHGEQRLFAGTCCYRLRRENGSFRISLKRVDLLNCDAYFEPLQKFI